MAGLAGHTSCFKRRGLPPSAVMNSVRPLRRLKRGGGGTGTKHKQQDQQGLHIIA